MCGIAGIWWKQRGSLDQAEAWLRSALSGLAHRGPDDEGVWIDRTSGVLLGHRRLSIIDLSPLGHQPMVADSGSTAIVFNGEIYNYRSLRRELERRGFVFRSDSDTEVLLNGYACWGAPVLERLVGMFAFAIWDGRSETLFLARDRAGEKPLYYATTPDGVAFASEIAPLTTLPDVDTRIDDVAVSLYLQYQYVPAPHSIFAGIRKLPPAHALIIEREHVRTWRYWDPVPIAAGPRLPISETEAIDTLEGLLREAVSGQMISDVPLGAFLSGGIDSTAVVSMMAELGTRPVRTFTIGFDVARYDESRHAARVARHLGTDHTMESLTAADAVALIPTVPEMYGEPFGDSSALPTHLVSRVARKHVTVSLSGDGGDEAFGGYTRYDELERILLLSRCPAPLQTIARAVGGRMPGRIGRGVGLLGAAPREVFRARVGVFRSADVQTMTGAAPPLYEFERAWAATEGRPARQRAMLADLLTYLPEAILVKVDRAAMSISLETRAPLLDHRVLEFALRLPPELTQGKRLLKRLVYRRVPRALVDRPKQGFGVPLGQWLREDLRDLLLDALTPARMEAVGIEQFSPIRSVLASHMSGAFDEYPRLWSLLMLSLWHDGCRTRAAAQRQVSTPLAPAMEPQLHQAHA
jgi:asparagine synthase (glutamine-hydrolysing)